MKYLVLLACIAVPIYPITLPIPGENLWRLINGVGSCLDIFASKVCIVDSQMDIWGTSVEAINSTIDATETMIDEFYSHIESVQEILCDKLIMLRSEIDIWASSLEHWDVVVLSVSDILINKISLVDVHLVSASDSIVSALEEFGSVLDSKIDALTECIEGTVLTQANFDSGTLFLSSPGVYTLCENVSSLAEPAIVIQSDNVFLDFNKHSLNHAGAISIDIENVSGVSVTNGSIISPSVNSIFISTAEHIFLRNIHTVNVNCTLGFSDDIEISGYDGIGAGSGIISLAVTNLVIKGSAVGGTTLLGYPIEGFLLQASSSIVTGCTVSGAQIGMLFFDARECVVKNVFIENAAVNGILIDFATTGFYEFDQVIVENSTIGLRVLNSGNILIKESSVAVCAVGLSIENSQNTVVKRSSIVNNGTGILIDALSSNTQILDSCVVSNTNNFIDNGIDTTVIDLGTVLEILCSKIENLDTQVMSQLEQATSVLDSYLDTALSELDILESAATCMLGIPITQADLPYSIPGPGVYTVCGSLLHNGTPVITNTFNNVVININGYTITTDNRAIVCTSGVTNFVVKNGTIRSGLEAIVLNDIVVALLEDIHIYQPADVGMRCTNVQAFAVSRCSVQGRNANTVGVLSPGAFYFENCGDGAVRECYAFGIPGSFPVRGFVVNNPMANGAFVFEQSVAQNIVNDGFLTIGTGSSLNTVLFDSCSALLSVNGFSVSNTTLKRGPSFIECLAIRCVRGFFGSNIIGSLFQKSIALHNSNAGFSTDNITSALEIIACISNNNLRGFDLPAVDSTVSGCSAIGNAFQGVRLAVGSGNTVVHGSLFGKNGAAGFTDGGATTPTVVDVRSQDPANAITPNPAYILNGAVDSKSSSVVVRTS